MPRIKGDHEKESGEKYMEEKLQKNYKEALAFWNQVLQSSEEDYADIDEETGWRDLGSESLCSIFDKVINSVISVPFLY